MSAVGIILSGGGARGAYEAGVLSYVFGDLVRSTGRVPRIDIISGNSVGAVNGTYLASAAHEPMRGVQKLVDLWYELDFSQVLAFGLRSIASIHRVWLGGKKPQGLFDAAPLANFIGANVSWLRLARNLRRGVIQGLTLATTHVGSGQPHIFVDLAPHVRRPNNVGRQVIMRNGPIRPQHVLASAAIPIIFPMVDIDGELHCDGGLRVNTPTAPAIHLGAKKLFIIGLSCQQRQHAPVIAADRAPGAPFLFGKVLDAFFLDHLDSDVHEIERINESMIVGEMAYGPDFIEQVNRQSRARGKPERHPVSCCVVRPSVDVGRIAHEFLRGEKRRTDNALAHTLLRALDVGEAAEADLASFLLFDSAYVRVLVELGRRDAAAMRDELADFFFSDSP